MWKKPKLTVLADEWEIFSNHNRFMILQHIRVDHPGMTQGIFNETQIGSRGTRDDLLRAQGCTRIAY